MRRLDPNRIGRVSMRPPQDQRYQPVSHFEGSRRYTELRKIIGGHIHSSKQDPFPRKFDAGPCDWCGGQKNDRGELYPYEPTRHNLDFGQPVVWCCCWPCFAQWLLHHLQVEAELDLWFALGVIPEYVPEWYMPSEVLESMLLAADWLAKNASYRCSDSQRWVAPRSLRTRR